MFFTVNAERNVGFVLPEIGVNFVKNIIFREKEISVIP